MVKKNKKNKKPVKKSKIVKKTKVVKKTKKQIKKVTKPVKKTVKKAKVVKAIKAVKKPIIVKPAKVIKPVKAIKIVEEVGGPISDVYLQTKLNNIFNKKVNKKTSGEVGIRTSTFLKEIGDYEFTEDQIKTIGDMLMDNNVKLSGKADKFKSNLSTYLLENVVEAKAESGGANSNGIIKRMFETLAASKPLTPIEEKKYIKMLGSRNDKIRKLGRDTLITSNLRLVASIARRHINKGVQLEDLILEGYLGLIKTIDKFDWNAKTKFSTYATWWIRQAITRTISDYGRNIRTPIHISEQLNKIRLAEEYLTNEYGKAPTIKQTCEFLGGEKKGFTEIKIIELKKITATPISLEKELKDDEESHISDFIKDDQGNSPKFQIENSEREDKIEAFLKNELDPEEYKIISLRFGIGSENKKEQLTLDEVSKKLKYTKDKVRTIEGKAWRKLKSSKGLKVMKKFLPYSVEDNTN